MLQAVVFSGIAERGDRKPHHQRRIGPVTGLMRLSSLNGARLLLEDNYHRVSLYDYMSGYVKEVFRRPEARGGMATPRLASRGVAVGGNLSSSYQYQITLIPAAQSFRLKIRCNNKL